MRSPRKALKRCSRGVIYSRLENPPPPPPAYNSPPFAGPLAPRRGSRERRRGVVALILALVAGWLAVIYGSRARVCSIHCPRPAKRPATSAPVPPPPGLSG